MPLLFGGGPLSPSGFRRRGRRRGLVVGAATGAAIAHHVTKKNAEEQAQDEAIAAAQQAQVAPTPGYSTQAEPAGYSAPAAPAASAETTQLQQLASLHAQGILTDEEFAAKKKQVLGI